MKTFKLRALLLFLVFITGVLSCQKNGGGGGPETEENLVVVTNPLANGHVEAPAPGPSFPLNVKINSKMPAGGVIIDVSARPDGGSVNFFTESKTTSSASSDFSITGATTSVTSVVTITVTSVTKASNTFTGSYKFSKK